MFDNLTTLWNDGIMEWFSMVYTALSTDYAFIGLGVLLLPVLRRLVRIFNHTI